MEPIEDPDERPETRIVVGLGNPGARYERTRHNVGFRIADRLASRLGRSFDVRLASGVAFRHRIEVEIEAAGVAPSGPPDEVVEPSGEALARPNPGRGIEVWCAKPFTYMNRSGAAVLELLAKCGDSQAGILIAYDDFHLPLGKLRFRASGSAGGQNGVQSVIDALGRADFPRLRVGIGSPAPGEDPADYVLAEVPPSDVEVLEEAVERAAEGAEAWARGADVRDCMNRYNG